MEPIYIRIRKTSSREGLGEEPLRFGVPLQESAIHDHRKLELASADSPSLTAQCHPISYWPDGSVRWLKVDTLLPSDLQSSTGLILSMTPVGDDFTSEVVPEDHMNQVEYNGYRLTPSHDGVGWHWSGSDGQHFSSRLRLIDQSNEACSAIPDGAWQISSRGPVVTVLTTTGWWHDSRGEKLARFKCELNCYSNGLVIVNATIHNPQRARHSGGLWDLGDPGSIYFGGMFLETDVANTQQCRLALSVDQLPREFVGNEPLFLHQESSGGENWNARNHVNAEGEVLPRYRGYRLQYGHHEPENGLRAEPVIEVRTTDSIISMSLPHFWQTFPSALQADDTAIRAWPFPADKPEAYELQGGERKTQQVVMGYGLILEQLKWSHYPSVPVLSPDHYRTTGSFPWFNPAEKDDRLRSLIQNGLDGPQNFFHKRELIDEYGWRNFGDLFADHETLYQTQNEVPHTSHYNNQYDAIYGFARQFALSGDTRWFELMDDLARHVTDIDIYHTDDDRAEYNHGLFWHTDHYLDAHTATHRTFSKHNTTSSTPGQTGGGPGAEHCYTTGLLYHYWMTGNGNSRDAALAIAKWMVRVHEGNGGLLEQILALKKQEIPKLKALIRREPVSRHRYPFTRGTGNYLNTLLDAHLLEPDQEWLQRAEAIITSTFHPADDISRRKLLDVETGWHYLVLLSSLSRYLLIKVKTKQFDTQYQYGLACLRHYSRWMCHHEEPFLTHPEKLEFANHTWTAQDIRKAMLMFQAANFDPDYKEEYLPKANEWLNYVINTLSDTPEQHFTRIQVILLQNYGPHETTEILPETALETPELERICRDTPDLTAREQLLRIIARIKRGIVNFRLKKEWAWLNSRLDRS